MNSKKKISLLIAVAGFFLVDCSPDHDTPPSKMRDSYVHAQLSAAPQESIKCGGDTYGLPASYDSEELGLYLLLVQATNTDSPLATMSIANMQKLYRDCLRPAIFKRVKDAAQN